jgi:hypothetical protein
MTHDELLAKITPTDWRDGIPQRDAALLAVVELHKPSEIDFPDEDYFCEGCSNNKYAIEYPCDTIQAIEKELK